MGIKNIVKRAAGKAGNAVAKLSVLSPSQLEEINRRRDEYLSEMPDPNDPEAQELTDRLLAACGVEIHDAYLPELSWLYLPVADEASYEFGREFDAAHNIRSLDIKRWVSDPKQDNLEKLVNVYGVLSDENCSIALVFRRTMQGTRVSIAVVNNDNAPDNVDVESYKQRIEDALKGNFPGAEWSEGRKGRLECLDNDEPLSVACVSNVPTEKTEKYLSQTIEKLLDGTTPANKRQEYTIVLLATPVADASARRMHLADIYSSIAPYSSWQTNYTLSESDAQMSGATVGVNLGASIGSQTGTTSGTTLADSTSQSEGSSSSESITDSLSSGQTHSTSSGSSDTTSQGTSNFASIGVGGGAGGTIGKKAIPVSIGVNVNGGHTWSASNSHGISSTIGEAATSSKARSVGSAIARNVGRAVTSSAAQAAGAFSGHSLGGSFGANFARSSNVTAMIGKNEGITQSFTNYTVKHALEMLDRQMKRYDEASALGMWDFAAYVLSEDPGIASNVAHAYLSLTEGKESFVSTCAVNVWRGDMGEQSESARAICDYLRDLRHPIFGLNPEVAGPIPGGMTYPATVTATTALTGKELAYSLNFPRSSVTGLPVLECASFGRDVITYDNGGGDGSSAEQEIDLGRIFHMRREEETPVRLSLDSLASHTFVTGSTGSGKSNSVYRILEQAADKGVRFLVIEPAKGEYKDVFGNREDVKVYGTNDQVTPLLRIDPFSFPKGIHVLEHLDRIVEIFNVCWPMYAAMPAVLKDALQRSYADCGWDLLSSTNEYGRDLFPTFEDVVRNVREIIDTSEYDAENKGAYKGSLLTRLQSLTNGINGMVLTSNGLSDEELFDCNAIVDLSRVGSSETKSLIMGLLVQKLQEHRMVEGVPMNAHLRHLTVLEEAHNILRKTSTDQPVEGGNLMGKSVEMLTNAIAEMRTYGEGFVIVDQSPGLLDMAAIRNTNTKIVMRLADQGDRELVGRAANLDDDQIREVARLPRGVAAIYQNEWVQPVLCKVAKVASEASGGYEYVKPIQTPPDAESPRLAAEVASILSSCTKLGSEAELKDLWVKMEELGLNSSTKVKIVREVTNPPDQPRMTKLGPVMSELFPRVRDAVERAHEISPEPSEWTNAATEELNREHLNQIAAQVRRDIVQAIVTDFLFNELHDETALRDWSKRGGLY